MRPTLALLALSLVLGGLALVVEAAPSSRSYQNAELRIGEFKVPAGWELVRQVSYPRIVVLAATSDGARLTLGVQRVEAGASALTLAADARAALERQRFTDVRVDPESDDAARAHFPEAMRLEAAFDRGRSVLRQEYIVDGDLAYVLTLYGPAARATRLGRELLGTLATLVITPLCTGDGGCP